MKNKYQIFLALMFLLFQATFCDAQIFVATTSASNCNTCDGNAVFTSSEAGDVTYSWYSYDNTNLFTETNATGNSLLSNLCSGIYYVVTTYPNNSDSITYFNIDTDITNNLDFVETILCSNSNINLNDFIPPNVSLVGTWTSPDNTVSDGVLLGDNDNPIPSGIYQYDIQEGACIISSGVNVIANEPANPGLSTTYLICENYPLFLMTDFLSGDPDYGGVWFDSNNDIISEIYNTDLQNTELFTYFIDTVEGCNPVFSTLYVIENVLPNSGLANEITICETGPPLDLFPLVGGAPDTNGTWFDENFQNVSMPFIPSENSEGIYTYMVPGDVPCPSTQSQLTINYTEGVYSGTGNDITLCESFADYNLFNLLSGNVSNNGNWTNQNNQIVDSILSVEFSNSGTYTYSVSLIGCSDASSSVVFSVETPIGAGSDTTVFLCETEGNYDLTNALSNDANLNGEWIQDNTEISSNFEILSYGIQEFTYQTINQECANDEAMITLQIEQSLFAGSDSTISFCQNNPEIILTDYLSNQSNDLGSWHYNNEPVNELFSPLNSSSGEYVYELNPENSCPISQASINISIIDSISFPQGLLIEECNYSQEINIGESSESNYSYQWTPDTYLSEDNISNPVINLSEITSPIDIIFNVDISNQACQKIIQREVTIHAAPVIDTETLFADCEGEIVTLDAGNFDEILWSPENLFQDSSNPIQNLTLTSSNTISLIVTNSNNCTSSEEIQLTVFPKPTVSYELNSQFHCTPATVEIVNTSFNMIPTVYYWDFSNDFESNEQTVIQSFDSPTSFNFSLHAESENGCSNTINYLQNIEVYETPSASFTYTAPGLSVFNNQIQLNNSSHFAQEYLWTIEYELFSEEESPTHFLPQIAGQNNLICLQAFNNQCTDSTCLNIYIHEEQNVYVPNTFTPNGDYVNDVFIPILLKENILEYSFKIFNRWGTVVFQTNDLDEGWIGDTNDNQFYYAKDETYIWQIKIKEKRILGEQIFKGKVTLIR